MLSLRQLRMAAVALAVGLTVAMVPVSAQELSAQAVDVSVTRTGDDSAQATFRIAVTNPGDSAITNVRVVFADGVETYVGDVAGNEKATSQPETRTLDLSLPTHNVAIPVTVTYSTADGPVEQKASLTMRVN